MVPGHPVQHGHDPGKVRADTYTVLTQRAARGARGDADAERGPAGLEPATFRGTELLTLAKHLLKTHDPKKAQLQLDFTILDRVTAWAESWKALDRTIEADLKT